MPEQVENFVTDGPTCHFDIKGMASMGLSLTAKIPQIKRPIAISKTKYLLRRESLIKF